MKKKLAVLLILSGITGAAYAADVYTWIDQNGVKHYSDQPPSTVEQADLKGGVKRVDYPSEQVNSMQPIVPETVDPGVASLPVNSKDSQQQGVDVSEDDPGVVGRHRNKNKAESDDLISHRDRLTGYSKQERIADINARKAQERADKQAIQEGSKTKERSKPQSLNKKLKKYNASKGTAGD